MFSVESVLRRFHGFDKRKSLIIPPPNAREISTSSGLRGSHWSDDNFDVCESLIPPHGTKQLYLGYLSARADKY
jgi:hypothetical protein